MIIGDRLRELRQGKHLSQGDIERRIGLLRCYISRVENGRTVPSVETLEKLARALEVPLYRLFYEGEKPPTMPKLLKRTEGDRVARSGPGEDAQLLGQFRWLLSKTSEKNQKILLLMAQKMARPTHAKT